MNLSVIRWHVDPAILHIGSFELRWYSLLFVSGFILGWFIFKWFFQREKIDTKLLDPLLYTLLICTIVGARLGHCLFYQPDYYLGSWQGFWEIFMPWKGGLASHGGTIALFIGIWWFARHYGKKHDLRQPVQFGNLRRGDESSLGLHLRAPWRDGPQAPYATL